MRVVMLVAGVMSALMLVRAEPQGTAGQKATPVFRTDTQYVPVNAIVTDSRDRVVTGLTKDDFVITANGREQKIADFSFVSIPVGERAVDLDAPTAPPSDVAFNAVASQTSRAFVFVIDDARIPASELIPLKRTMAATLSALSTGDQVAVVYTSRSDLSQDFTSDINRLIDSVNNRRGAIGLGLPYPQKSLMVVLRNVVASLSSSRHARRAVFLVGSSGCVPSPPNPEWVECMELVKQAWRADVPFYVIDPRLFTRAQSADMSITTPEARTGAAAAEMAERDSMMTLASATGGRAVTAAADPAKAAASVIAENGSYYLMGFYPEPALADGQFHDIKVTVKRPGLIVRSRRGYLAPATTAKPTTATRAMTSTLGAGLDDPSLPIRAFAAPLSPAPRGLTRTLVTLEIAYPVGEGANRVLDDDVRVGILALTPDGKVKASFQRPIKINGTWLPAAHGRLVINETIDLPTDALALRVGVTSRALGKTGTAHIRVEPPDFTDKDLQLSGIVLGSSAMVLDAAMGLDTIRGIVPFQPTTKRAFTSSETLRVFARVSWGKKVDAATVHISVVGPGAPPAQSVVVSGRRGPSGHSDGILDVPLSLASLAPGGYILRVEATQPGAKPFARAVPFEVVR